MRPTSLPRLVLASGNPGKLREFRALLAGVAGDVVAQSELGVEPIEETGTTFLSNALLKARHAANATGEAALADDSGLEVDALGGAPGVRSARYAGEDADAAANNTRLLAALAGVLPPRRARYRAVIALVRNADDPTPVIAEGCWDGWIALAPRGHGGFGYDPVFLVGDDGSTAAELAPDVKNRLSHRGQALRSLLRQLAAP